MTCTATCGNGCADGYSEDYYRNSPADDPPGPANRPDRLSRGGGWDCSDGYCRSAFRREFPPGYSSDTCGFRVMAVPSAAQSSPASPTNEAARTGDPSPEQKAAAAQWGRPVTETNSIGMKLTLIPAGEFLMGSPESAEEVAQALGASIEWLRLEHPQHRVRLSKPFYLGVTR